MDDPEPEMMGGPRTVGGYSSAWVQWQWAHGTPYRVCDASCGHYNQTWVVRAPNGVHIRATVYWWPDDDGVYRKRATISPVYDPGTEPRCFDRDLPVNRLLAEIDAEKPTDWHPWQDPIPPGWRAKRQPAIPRPWGRQRDAEPFPLAG